VTSSTNTPGNPRDANGVPGCVVRRASYAYHWGLKRAKAHLAALGTPKRKMSPFDESKFEPMPEVDIDPKDEHWVDPGSLD
jgi:hypothetical protein